MTPALREDTKTAAVIYRRAEAAAHKLLAPAGIIKLRMAQDLKFATEAREAWADVQTKIEAHYANMIPKTKRDRDRGIGPKVFDVHHAIEVARQCYQLALCRKITSSEQSSPAVAADFTLHRIGVLGDLEMFYADRAKDLKVCASATT